MSRTNFNSKNESFEHRLDAVKRSRLGWQSWLALFSMAALLFETITGLVITLGPFHPFVQWSVLAHTAVGSLALLPTAWYCSSHWWDYRRWTLSHVVLLGYVALLGLTVCSASGVVYVAMADERAGEAGARFPHLRLSGGTREAGQTLVQET